MQLAGIVITAIPATIAACSGLIAAGRSLKNGARIEEVHHMLNSALEKRVESAKAEGNLAGRLQQTEERKEAKGNLP